MRNERGVTLIEALMAILIVSGLILAVAYTFSTGRGNVQHLAWRRAALAMAQDSLEQIMHNNTYAPDTVAGPGPDINHANARLLSTFMLSGQRAARESSYVWWEPDPAIPTTRGNKVVQVSVSWSETLPQRVFLQSIIPPPYQ